METLAPIPKVGEIYWFYANDQIKKETEYQARVTRIFTIAQTEHVWLQLYDNYLEDVIATPLMDKWIEESMDMFWIMAEKTDFVIELMVPELCQFCIYVARDIDGGWHSFVTHVPKEWGILDVTGEYHEKLNCGDTDDLPPAF